MLITLPFDVVWVYAISDFMEILQPLSPCFEILTGTVLTWCLSIVAWFWDWIPKKGSTQPSHHHSVELDRHWLTGTVRHMIGMGWHGLILIDMKLVWDWCGLVWDWYGLNHTLTHYFIFPLTLNFEVKGTSSSIVPKTNSLSTVWIMGPTTSFKGGGQC